MADESNNSATCFSTDLPNDSSQGLKRSSTIDLTRSAILGHFGWPDTSVGSNFAWTCGVPRCLNKKGLQHSGHGISRMISHAKTNHSNNMKVMEDVWEWESKQRSNKRTDGSSKRHKGPIMHYLEPANTAIEQINLAAAKMIVSMSLPLSFFDNKPAREFINTCAAVSRSTESTGVLVSSLIHTRPQLTMKWIPMYCNMTFAKVVERLRQSAKQTFCTLCQDGRSNINHDALLVWGYEIQGEYIFVASTNCGSKKKDVSFLTECAKQFLISENGESSDDPSLFNDAGFSNYVSSYCTDGALSCKMSALQLEKEFFVIPIRYSFI